MDEKSPRGTHFYGLDGPVEDGRQAVLPTASTAGPWSPDAQHGGPPAALLTRALEALPEAAGRVLGRVGVDLLGPVPLGPLATSATVLRPGRTVCLVQSELHDVAAGRPVARATGWLFPRTEATDGGAGSLPGTLPSTLTGAEAGLEHGPDDGFALERPASWLGGYLDAVEWRWISGALERPGPGVVWMRAPRLVDGEDTSGTQRLMACVDSASGVSSALDLREWSFLNTELTVHLLREPVGEWLCLDAVTTLAGTSTGVCTASVHDREGLVARSAQALLVVPTGR